jgi:hypothetical protein
MRTGISFTASPTDQARMKAIVADRNSPQKHVWRCRIVLPSAAGQSTAAIVREAGVAKTAVWRWQERFMLEGVDGLLNRAGFARGQLVCVRQRSPPAALWPTIAPLLRWAGHCRSARGAGGC